MITLRKKRKELMSKDIFAAVWSGFLKRGRVENREARIYSIQLSKSIMYQERLKSKATETTFPSAWRKHRKESGPVIRADDVKVTAQSKQPPAPICFSILLQELGKMENWFSKEIIKPLKWVQTRRCRCTTSQDLWEHRLRVRRLETAKPPDF